MKKYFYIFVDDKRFRVEIDEELDKALRKSLKDNYQFENNILKLNTEDNAKTYLLKTKTINNLINLINTYELDPELAKRVEYLKKQLSFNRTTVYESDLRALEELLNEVTNIYGTVRTTLIKKDQAKIIHEQNEALEQAINDKFSEVIDDSSDDSDANIEDIRLILNKLKEDVDLADLIDDDCIDEALDNIIICKTMEEYLEVSSREKNVLDINELIEGSNFKKEKIIIPPHTSIKEIITKLVKSSYFQDANKIITSDIHTFNDELQAKLQTFKKNISVNFNSSNLEYYSKKFIQEYQELCTQYNQNPEDLFSDYFKGRSNILTDFYRNLNFSEPVKNEIINSVVNAGIKNKVISNKYLDKINTNFNISNQIKAGANTTIDTASEVTSSSTLNQNINSTFNANRDTSSQIQANSNNSSDVSASAKTNLDINASNNPNISGNINMSYSPNTESTSITGGINTRENIHAQVNHEIHGSETTGVRNLRRNTNINALIYGNSDTTELTTNQTLEEENTPYNTSSASSFSDNDSYLSSTSLDTTNALTSTNLDNDLDNNLDNETNNNNNNTTSNNNNNNNPLSSSLKQWFLKHKVAVILTVGGILFFILIIFCIIGGDSSNNSNLGYYDSTYNFNETNVVLTACNSEEVIANVSLEEFVVNSLYAYTHNNNYNDEALKAALIVLKTNALSYGNYHSSNKVINLDTCTFNYCNPSTCELNNEDVPLDSPYLTKLNDLYNEVSNYLYISESYKDNISSLSSKDALTFDLDTLNNFQELSLANNTYAEILSLNYPNNNTEITYDKETYYIGDSRMQGILNTGLISSSNTIYGASYGYNWFVGTGTFSENNTNAVNGAIPYLNNLIDLNTSYNIVIWLGVNDYNSHDANTYYNKFYELATNSWQNEDIYIVSVGPVLDSSSQYAKNSEINNFNNTLKTLIENQNLSNLKYIDLNYNEDSINIYDSEGIHYGNSDYANILSIINDHTSSSISSNLYLYNLSDHLVYYTVTSNDAYWWPVGSSNPTSGNIYGGTPVTTEITSTFGNRVDPITQEKQSGHGALDIGTPLHTQLLPLKVG